MIPEYPDPENYDSSEAYAIATVEAIPTVDTENWAIGGQDPISITEIEYAVEPRRGAPAVARDSELAGPIEDLPDFALGARIIKRTVTYGAWEYVTADEIRQ